MKRKRKYSDGGELTKGQKIGNSITGALGGATSLLSNIIDVSKTPDVTNIENRLDTAQNRTFNGGFDDLLGQYKSYSDIDSLSYSDIGGLSDAQTGIGALKGAGAGASLGSSILPGWGTAIGAAVGGVGSLVGGLFGRNKAKQQQEKLNEEINNINTMNQNKLANAFSNAGLQQSLNQRQQMFAQGGYLGNDYFSPITTFNAGGTHEQNPYQGILQGYDNEGNPNLVEEGEVKWNDYIFSNRLGPDESTLSNYRLPKKYANDSFAYIAEKLSKEMEERPNDPISKNTFENNMVKLQRSQEKVKQNNALEAELNEYCNGGKLRKLAYGDGLDGDDTTGILDDAYYASIQPKVSNDFLMEYYDMGDTVYAPHPNSFFLPVSLPEISRQPADTNKYIEDVTHRDALTGLTPIEKAIYDTIEKEEGGKEALKYAKRRREQNSNDGGDRLPTWMRYAPIVSGGLGVLSDVLGLTNKPDYTDANELKREIDKINPISSTPIGDYLPYNPIDVNYWYNRNLANNRGINRSLIDNSNGSGALANANLIANNYNFTNSIGSLGFEGENQNWTRLKDVAAFNRGTNQYNSTLDFDTQKANQEVQKNKLGLLNGYYNLLNTIDTYSNQARNANLSRFVDNLARIGDENFAMNQVNSNGGLYYGLGRDGWQWYKSPEDVKSIKVNSNAYGGKLRHTRKNTYTLDLI